MDKDSDKNGELRFNLGGNISDVYIDNVVMKKQVPMILKETYWLMGDLAAC